jgi:YolD-like protein
MIRDRGNIKWVAMMLPEHVKALREFGNTHDLIEKPVLDEDKIEEINQLLCLAMEYNKLLEFTYYDYGKLIKVIGNIHYIEELNKEIRIINRGGELIKIDLKDIIDVCEY